MKRFAFAAAAIIGGCAHMPGQQAAVERMYVIECGENHAKDVSRWTPGVNVGKPHVFGNHCYLVRHAKGWMLWDTGNADRIAAMPNGLTAPTGILTAYMKKPLAESLREIGVAPADIQHFAMSHSHGDHSGNANLFSASTLYMQAAEYDAVFGPEPQKYNFIAANFEKLRGAKAVKLGGDHDVFGDGSVVIKAAPGHTPGHQVLVVRLPKTGPVMLSGDMVHILAKDYQPRDVVFAARDRADETVERIRSVRSERYKYIRNFYPQRPQLQPNNYKDHKPCLIALRQARADGKLSDLQEQLLFSPTRPKEELYDLSADRWEMNNLASDPAHSSVLTEMRQRLDRWIEEANDHGRTPEPARMYDSDMDVYLGAAGKKGRNEQLEKNIAQMKQWAAEGK